MWGLDAYEFQLERLLEMKGQVESPIGRYENLYGHAFSFYAGYTLTHYSPRAAFSGGVGGCLGLGL